MGAMGGDRFRHCEDPEAALQSVLDCFAALAMTPRVTAKALLSVTFVTLSD